MKVGDQAPANVNTGLDAPRPQETPVDTEKSKFAGVMAKKGDEAGQAEGKSKPEGAAGEAAEPGAEGMGMGMGHQATLKDPTGKFLKAAAGKPLPGATGKPLKDPAGKVVKDPAAQMAKDGPAADPASKLQSKREAKEADGKEVDGPSAGERAEEEPKIAKDEAEQAAAAPSSQPGYVAPLEARAQQVESPRPVYEARQIKGIVQEIQTVVHPGGKTQVDIQLNSQTLDGLQIRITRDDTGKIAIQFSTQSDDVSQLLDRNMGNLTQSLAGRGLQVAGIQIVNPALATPQAQMQAQAQVQAQAPNPVFQSSESRRDERESDRDRGGEGRGDGGQEGREQQQRGQR